LRRGRARFRPTIRSLSGPDRADRSSRKDLPGKTLLGDTLDLFARFQAGLEPAPTPPHLRISPGAALRNIRQQLAPEFGPTWIEDNQR
jgi:hypothetical protein